MFEQLERKRIQPRSRLALWAAVLGAFGVGFNVRGFAAGAKSWDGSWTLAIVELVIEAGMVVWLAVAATSSCGHSDKMPHVSVTDDHREAKS